MRKSDPRPIGDILAGMVRKTDLGKKLDQARIWDEWAQVAGGALHEHGRPHAIKDGTLVIEVDSTVWMNRYAYQKWHILKRVNRLTGKELVKDIFIMLTPDGEGDLKPPSGSIEG